MALSGTGLGCVFTCLHEWYFHQCFSSLERDKMRHLHHVVHEVLPGLFIVGKCKTPSAKEDK